MIADTESAAHADDAADAGAARTFRVRVENLPALRERIERIDRRARRLGTGPVQLVDTGRRQAGRAVVVLCGHVPRLEGWRIAAVVSHREADAALRPVPGARPCRSARLTGEPGAAITAESRVTARRRSYSSMNTTPRSVRSAPAACAT